MICMEKVNIYKPIITPRLEIKYSSVILIVYKPTNSSIKIVTVIAKKFRVIHKKVNKVSHQIN